MNTLNQEIENNLETWAKLGIDCFKEHPVDEPEKPYRAYLTSKTLGGTLAVNHGEGWIPIYPEKPNYPMKGRWYSPGSRWLKKESGNWEHAITEALNPIQQHDSTVLFNSAKDRAVKLRDPFRAQVIIALIKTVNKCPVEDAK